MTELERQHLLDEEHLRLLRIGYFIAGGTTAFAALFGLVYVALGAFFLIGFSGSARPNDLPPMFVGWLFGLIGLAFSVFFGVLALLKFLTARALRLRRSRVLCLVTAGLACISIPYGTALGIFTFVVLNRPSVMALFGASPPPTPQVPSPVPNQTPEEGTKTVA